MSGLPSLKTDDAEIANDAVPDMLQCSFHFISNTSNYRFFLPNPLSFARAHTRPCVITARHRDVLDAMRAAGVVLCVYQPRFLPISAYAGDWPSRLYGRFNFVGNGKSGTSIQRGFHFFAIHSRRFKRIREVLYRPSSTSVSNRA